MNRFICVHGHFYQPPRESPWLETIQPQSSAYPYHDWNERIAAECYGPNAKCRILDGQDRIVKIVNNYSRMSFNFGPTLLSWMEDSAPEIHQAILDADAESARLFSGHGSAIAQAYNHIILPLADRRQKEIQVAWGIRDFERRFGRSPEGMWLPETAVDVESLEVLAAAGIRYTVLAPRQAEAIRKIGGKQWVEVDETTLDTSQAYRAQLPSGAHVDLFFYDGATSRAVAFEGLLRDGEAFAKRLLSRFASTSEEDQLVHIATDGETYGHHHRFGDMALAYALDFMESEGLAKLTNYGEWLERRPPTWEVRIHENSSWSCAHGIERWRSDCGCHTGTGPGWRQKWRGPLRDSLDWLAATADALFSERGATLLRDPGKAFDDYIEVVLDRSRANVESFFQRHGVRSLGEEDRVTALKLLEMMRHSVLMYTSCGWFFDEISGIEATQVILYAGRAVQLAEELSETPVEEPFLRRLALAPSNLPEHGDGREIYEKFVRPARVDLLKVGAHYALSSLFEDYGETTRIACFTIQSQGAETLRAGRGRIAVGKARVASEMTQESEDLSFAAFHLGDHILNGGVRAFQSEDKYEVLRSDLEATVERVDFAGLIRLLDSHFKGATYSLDSLFQDEQKKILKIILDSSVAEVEASMQSIYERHTPLMRYLENLHIALPTAFEVTAQFVLNTQFRRALLEDDLDLKTIQRLLGEAERRQVPLDAAGLSYELERTLARMAERAFGESFELEALQKIDAMVDLSKSLPFSVNLWQVQDQFYRRLKAIQSNGSKQIADAAPPGWLERFLGLGDKLKVRVDMALEAREWELWRRPPR